MRRWLWSGGLVVLVLLGLARIGWTQEAVRPTIHNVTSELVATGEVVLVITGVGFGETPVVTIDGQLVAVLAGGSATRLTVLAPAAVLTTPGTYRLTVVDPARQLGDAFVVAGLAGTTVVTGAPLAGVPSRAATTGVTNTSGGSSEAQALAGGGGVTPLGVENPASPYDTAYGFEALLSNTASGLYNSAFGMQALKANTSGTHNTAAGLGSLRHLTTGIHNTAVGTAALDHVTTTNNNTAVGTWALEFSTGDSNTAVGTEALQNTSGSDNAAFGFRALEVSSTGTRNAALGYLAGSLATTGHYNLFLGAGVNGTASDTNTIRIGSVYNGATTPPSGQNQTFIAGIRSTPLGAGAAPVVIDANGQLGTSTSGVLAAGAGYGCAGCGETGKIELYNPSTGDMTIQSAPHYRMLLNPAGGTIGVGVNSVIGSGAQFGCTYCAQSGFIKFYDQSTGNMTIQSAPWFAMLLNPGGGNVGIGTTSPQYKLHVAGDIYTSGLLYQGSDARLKDQVQTLGYGLPEVLRLRPVSYRWKDAKPGQPALGLIAQEVEPILPELVARGQDEPGLLSLNYTGLVPVLIKAMQEQQAQKDAEIAELRTRLAALEAQMARLLKQQETPGPR